jgi:phosphatidylglycerol---prolipoprotein diacylglyceryl transferase
LLLIKALGRQPNQFSRKYTSMPLLHPEIDPIILRIWGPFQITWYSLLYVGGFLLGRTILKRLAREERFQFTEQQMDDFGIWLLIGAVIGARIVYCVVYDFSTFIQNPLWLFQTYKGGLSFHGGLIGAVVAALIFSRRNHIPFWNLTDAMALATPTGLALGRIGNFINGELYGRQTTMPWGMVFRTGGPIIRHPSQLYEFFLEGVVLFSVLWFLKDRLKKDGQISVLFLIGYTFIRFVVEFFREPDAQLGYLTLGLSMGQILSLMQLIGGLILAWILSKQPSKPISPENKNKSSV